jgi:predicted nucleic-acid-binding Zn-ribbon protein
VHAAPCPKCGSALSEAPPVVGLVETMLASFLSAADQAELEGMVEVRCEECGYVGSAAK